MYFFDKRCALLHIFLLCHSFSYAASQLPTAPLFSQRLRAAKREDILKEIEEEQKSKESIIENRNDTRDSYDKYIHNQAMFYCNARLCLLRERLKDLQE